MSFVERSAGSKGTPPSASPGDVTLATYEAVAVAYGARNEMLPPAVAGFLDRVAATVGDGHVLELGSGPGRDAAYLERKGVRITRTDAADAFVEMLHEAGHQARRLDVRTDDLGGPHDAVLANAVLLHLTRPELADALARIRAAVRAGGMLAFTVKEGTGAGWTNSKVGHPRYFTYWREQPLRSLLAHTGWTVRSLEHSAGSADDWLLVIAA